jgi:hypothetical protein
MRPPTLSELPAPPAGKSGWPWTEASPPLELPPAGLPKISIVTPSYNQGQYLEETIRSVLLQGYPNLEYIIMDGGSRDDSVAIIRKYEPWIASWTSAKDGGQPDAINQGWARATGEVKAWLNSDDWFHPGVLAQVAKLFQESPALDWVSGQVDNCWSAAEVVKRHDPHIPTLAECLGRHNYGMHQPGMFWRSHLLERTGPLDTGLQYSFCHDFWARMLLLKPEARCVARPWTFFRLHEKSKTCSGKHIFLEQDWQVFERYQQQLSPADRRQARAWLQAYAADQMLDVAYGLLARGKRGEAAAYLVRQAGSWHKVRPWQCLPGLLIRTFVTGKAPVWFRT